MFSLSLMQQIVNYLQQRPWVEVNNLIVQIETEFKNSEKLNGE